MDNMNQNQAPQPQPAPAQPQPQQAAAPQGQPAPQPAPAQPQPAPAQPQGQPVQPQQAAPQPQQAAQQPRQVEQGQPPKKKKTGLIIGIIAVVVIVLFIGFILLAVVIGAVVLFVSGSHGHDAPPYVTPMVDPGPQYVEQPVEDGLNPLAIEDDDVNLDDDGLVSQPNVIESRYTTYKLILEDLKEDIEAYNWVMFMYVWEGEWNFSDYTEAPRIALADLTGDNEPELIVVHRKGSSMEDMYMADLDIYDGSSMNPIFHMDNIDYDIGGGRGYMIATSTKPGTMFLWTSENEDVSYETYASYRWDGETFVYELICNKGYDWDDAKEIYTPNYSDADGNSISEDDYNEIIENYANNVDEFLLANQPMDEFIAKKWEVQYYYGYTYDQAMNYVDMAEKFAGSTDRQSALDFFKEYTGNDVLNLEFSSGAGAWGSDMSLCPDGSFFASYHDSNAGESGDGYDSTVYIGSGAGFFDEVVKIDDNKYLTRIKSFELDDTPGEEEFESYDGYITRYHYDKVYGVNEGSYIIIYTPDTPVADLSEDFMFWSHLEWLYEELPDTLNARAIYDPINDAGFVEYYVEY